MRVSIETIAEKLLCHKEFKIVYHIRPDGDCIGSAYALALALRARGARCRVVGRDPVPQIHRYLTDRVPNDEVSDPVWVAIDAVSPARTGNFSDVHYTFCLDHHNGNSIEADYKYVEEDCGACSEIVFKVIRAIGVEITKEIADLLYTAIITDTMSFRTTDTKPQTFEVAAELARCGADVFGIGRLNTFIKSPERMAVEDILRSTFHYTCGGKAVTAILMLRDLETAGILDSELEGINSLVEQVASVRVGATLRELPDGTTRCSMRSNGDISVNDICALHGGGGHYHAAVCEFPCSPTEAREIIEETVREYLAARGIA